MDIKFVVHKEAMTTIDQGYDLPGPGTIRSSDCTQCTKRTTTVHQADHHHVVCWSWFYPPTAAPPIPVRTNYRLAGRTG